MNLLPGMDMTLSKMIFVVMFLPVCVITGKRQSMMLSPTVILVLCISSFWEWTSHTTQAYVTVLSAGTCSFGMKNTIFATFIPLPIPCAKHPISFDINLSCISFSCPLMRAQSSFVMPVAGSTMVLHCCWHVHYGNLWYNSLTWLIRCSISGRMMFRSLVVFLGVGIWIGWCWGGGISFCSCRWCAMV